MLMWGGVAFVAVCVLAAALIVLRAPTGLGGDILSRDLPTPGRDTVEYTLPAGSTAADVGRDLQALGVIRSSAQFETIVRLMGLQDQLSAGEYILRRGSSSITVIGQITVREGVETVRVTFPEGIRIEEMAVIAERAGFGTAAEFIEATLTVDVPEPFAAALPPAASLPANQRLQGYLFPDTYILPVGSTMTDLVELMLATLEERFSPELRAAALAQGLDTHQALTLAAIVEREAVLPPERPLIAGVFYNRIREGDLIGADPTTQYAVSLNPASVAAYGWWKLELTLEDLASESPYNTRKFAGIPPGPITNPGLASIEAVARPLETRLYYFVADSRKGDGSHVFAETLAEHERNIAIYGAP
jgi:UPF0755 protein